MAKKDKNFSHAFLMELQTEDIPVRFLKKAKEGLSGSLEKILEEAGLSVPGLAAMRRRTRIWTSAWYSPR